MSSTVAYEVRAYRPGDEEPILAAFNRIFARVDPGFHPRTLAEWRWLYEQNPSGCRVWLAVAEDGRVLAQYAGLPQRVLLDGRPGFFSQSVDSMSDPDFKKLSREPLFVQVGRAFDAAFGGEPPDKDTLMWGLPVPVAFRIGKKALKYELVRQQHKLSAPLAELHAPASHLEAEEVERFPDEIDGLFARLARERRCLTVRDRAQLAWRYETNPNHRYRLAFVRRGGELAGMAVYRKGSFDLCEDGLLVDWLAPAEDEGVRAALFAWVLGCARAEGCELLTSVFADVSPEWLHFQRLGLRVRATRYFLVAWSFSERHGLDWIRRHWHYTLGDTDLA
jgi:hypothetical protein